MERRSDPGRLEIAVTAAVGVAIVAGLIVAYRDADLFGGGYAREDGVVEWATVAFLLAGAGLAAVRACRAGSLGARLTNVVVALIFTFGAGEELSWGQRIFAIETPEAVRAVNLQGEMNLHNIEIGGIRLNTLVFSQLLGVGVILYAFVLPVVHRYSSTLRARIDRLTIPVPATRHALLILIYTSVVLLIPHDRKWELLELSSSALFVLIVAFPKNIDAIRSGVKTTRRLRVRPE